MAAAPLWGSWCLATVVLVHHDRVRRTSDVPGPPEDRELVGAGALRRVADADGPVGALHKPEADWNVCTARRGKPRSQAEAKTSPLRARRCTVVHG